MEHNIPICSLRDVMGRLAGPKGLLTSLWDEIALHASVLFQNIKINC